MFGERGEDDFFFIIGYIQHDRFIFIFRNGGGGGFRDVMTTE